MVDAHRKQYGEWCPGWGRIPPHSVVLPNILTADHEVAVAAGGEESGLLVVRCRQCNSIKGARSIKIEP